MSSFRGTIRKNPLEGGFFELHSENGTIYRLEGKVNAHEGDEVEVQGSVDAGGGFGIHMTGGPTLKVQSIQRIGAPSNPGSSVPKADSGAQSGQDLPGSTSKSSC